MSYYFAPRLFIARLPPEEGYDDGQVIVDKPIMRLPSSIENIPKNINTGISRMTRRMQIWRYKAELPGKPWQSERQRRDDYRRRRVGPPRSIKPKLDD